MKLVSKILLFFISLVIILSIIRTYSGVQIIENTVIHQLEKRLSSDLNLLTFAIDRELYHIEKHLILTSGRDKFRNAVKNLNIPILQEILSDALQKEDLDVVRLTHSEGRTILTWQNRFVQKSINISKVEKNLITKGFTMVKMGVQEFPALFVSIPLKDSGSIYGHFTGFTILNHNNDFLNSINEILAKQSAEPVYISIFNEGAQLFSTLLSETELKENKLSDAIQHILYSEKRQYAGRNHMAGAHYIVTYRPVQDYNGNYTWAYGIAIQENILTRFKNKLLLAFIGISVFATGAVIAIALLVTRGIHPSLDKIVNTCREIEAGNFQSSINTEDIKIKEFKMIAASMNKMAESIAEREEIITKNLDAIQTINTELQEKSATIKSERQKFLVLLETMEDGLITVDSKGAITYFNRAAELITGIDRHMAIGRHCHRFFPNLNVHTITHAIVRELKVDEPLLSLHIKMYISPYTSGTSENGLILLFRDISKEKKVEEFKADFISSIAHDIKSLLVPVAGFLNRILQGKYGSFEEPLREKLTNIQDNTSKIYQLVENYLNISKIESGRLELALVPSDIFEIINAIVHLYGPRVKLLVSRKLPPVLVDPLYIERVLINLIMNALKFSKDDSTVFVNASQEGSMVVVSVKDEGIGIPPEEIQYIFEKYRRGSFGKSEGGSGLGLFIVKSIVKAHGGDIWIESIVGKGSTFYFSLPIVKGET